MNRAVFLDRDGVINKNDRPVNLPKHLKLYDHVGKAIQLLNEHGLKVFVVTNQGGVGLGYLSEGDLNRIHEKLISDLAQEDATIDEISACIHKPKQGCSCRKPEAGMLSKLADKHEIALRASYMIGDRVSDIEAGKTVGTKTIFIGKQKYCDADYQATSVMEAVQWILKDLGISTSARR